MVHYKGNCSPVKFKKKIYQHKLPSQRLKGCDFGLRWVNGAIWICWTYTPGAFPVVYAKCRSQIACWGRLNIFIITIKLWSFQNKKVEQSRTIVQRKEEVSYKSFSLKQTFPESLAKMVVIVLVLVAWTKHSSHFVNKWLIHYNIYKKL